MQTLAVSPTEIVWTLDGAAPQFTRVQFELSTDGVNYTPLVGGTSNFAARSAAGSMFENILEQIGGTFDENAAQFAPQANTWMLSGLNLPTGQNIYIRARGFYRNGLFSSSESILETVKNVFLVPLAPPELSINDVYQIEGNAGTTNYTFSVTLSEAASSTVTVNYATADNTATVADSDYAATSGTLTFAPGDLTKTITVTVNGDTKVELNETFFVNLSSPANAVITDNQGTGTIENDDTPTLSINDVSQTEGSAGTSSFNFTVTLSQASPLSVTVDYATADNTATVADSDYASTSGTLTFAPGDLTKTFTVQVSGDTKVELNETFFVNLNNAANATIADGQGLGTIENDDTPTLSINDVSQTEGNSGTSDYSFTVTLSQASPLTVTVNYATADNTATVADGDYAAASGTLTFAPGDLTKTITVQVNGDTKVELNETFFVNLTNATNASISDNQGLGTIENDDTPTLSINDVSQTEGNAGTTNFAFTVTLSQASPLTVSVDYATADNTATVAGNDYAAATGTLTFAPGDLTKTINVTVNGDTTVELNENFFVNLTNATNATVSDNQGLGTIENDDVPTLSINDVSQTEGNAGTTNFAFTVTLSQASPLSVSVDYATADNTATVADNDYASTNGSLTFAPGDLTKTVTVQVNGDTKVELNETFFVNLTNAMNATVSDAQGVGTIENDDTPTLSINDVSQVEGDAGTSNFNFTVTLSQASPLTVSVDFATADGTATVADNDYASTSGTLTFAPGDLTKTVTVAVNGDFTFELNETFFIDLSNPTNATIVDGQGMGTIQNDDSQSLKIKDVRIREGNEGTSIAEFTVSLTTDMNRLTGSSAAATVDYQTADGTATAGTDYTAANGTLTFQPGETEKTIEVTINGDTQIEPNETFFVNLSSSTNATISDNQAVGIIVDEDRAYTGDFDRDLRTDFTVFRPTTDFWYTLQSSNDVFVYNSFGTNGDIPVPGDYDADGKTDLAVFRPSVGTWYIQQSSNFTFIERQWGAGTDKPVQGDYDGDGKTDIAVFRDGVWFVIQSSNNTAIGVNFGATGDVPVQGDYDGDGRTDYAVYRAGTWFVKRSSDNGFFGLAFGAGSDKPVVGDFDGDGKSDFAVYRAGTWFIYESLTQTSRAIAFGDTNDIPTPGDYDGDGTSDISVYREGTNAVFYIIKSSDNSFAAQTWGQTGDKPIPAYYQSQLAQP